MHSIRIDRINRLIEQRISGTPDIAEVEESGAAVRKAVHSLTNVPGTHVTLYDLTGMGPVGDDVIASALRQFADPRFSCVQARKVAMVIPSAMARMKIGPVVTERTNMALFTARDDAMRWLFDRAPAARH